MKSWSARCGGATDTAAAPDRSHLDWYDEAAWRELAAAAPAGTRVAALLALMAIEVEDDRPAVGVALADLAAVPRPEAPRLLPCGAQEGYAYAKLYAPDALIGVWARAVEVALTAPVVSIVKDGKMPDLTRPGVPRPRRDRSK